MSFAGSTGQAREFPEIGEEECRALMESGLDAR
jgi:hypothetical protein